MQVSAKYPFSTAAIREAIGEPGEGRCAWGHCAHPHVDLIGLKVPSSRRPCLDLAGGLGSFQDSPNRQHPKTVSLQLGRFQCFRVFDALSEHLEPPADPYDCGTSLVLR